jgi:hypothetical protein
MRNSTILKLAGPKTFRRASTKIMKRWGGNLQNVNKDMRKIYQPDGYRKELEAKCKYWLQTGDASVFSDEELETLMVFIQSDQAGAEALIVAYDCEPGQYRQLFINGIKVHVYVAMKLFPHIWKKKLKESGGLVEDFNIEEISETPINKLKQNPFWHDLDKLIKDSDNWQTSERYYYFAKQTCHSANYDVQASMFRMNTLEKSGGKVYLPMDEAERFLVTYRSLFPEIPEGNRRIEEQVRKTGIIYNLFGHPYQVTDYNITKIKDYFAWPRQSTVGEITRIAFSNLQNYIWDTHQKWDVLQDNHDSYLCQCRLMDVLECQSKMRDFMNQKLISPVDGTEFNMKSEQQIGFNWSPFKPEKNEVGLREVHWN